MEQAGRNQAVLEQTKGTRRALVLMHPFVDKCSPEDVRRDITGKVIPRGWACDMVGVGSAADLDVAAKRGREGGYDLVVVAGGDGTISRVARHLVGADTVLGIMPVGKDNNLAVDLGIPADSTEAAALLAGDHEVGYLDALRVGDRHFFLQVGTAASLPSAEDTTDLHGESGAEAASGGIAPDAAGFQSRRFSLQIDGRHYRLAAWQVIVVNTGGLRSETLRSGVPNDPSDRVAELVALRVRSAWDLLKAAFGASRARRDAGISITYHRFRDDVLLVPDQPMPVEGDGESIGTTPVRVSLAQGVVRVIVPRVRVEHQRAASGSRRRRHMGAGWFRMELLRRLGPIGVLDTALFLAVSRLPHPRPVNVAMRAIEVGMASGRGWIALVFVANFPHWRKLWREELGVAPLIWLTSAVTEYPIKAIFARPRPFVALMLTSVVGRKPSSHSLPSGHSSAAFAGAWLLSRRHPRWTPFFYAFASLVAFSRVYQGVHYPSDVAIGAVTGTVLASTFRWTLGQILSKLVGRP